MEKATLAAGCFWCTEEIFRRLKGVESVVSGYAGGRGENVTYEKMIYENTGHAEAIQITFDPNIVSYIELLEVFWRLHDPTTLNRQGYDVGSQYRSVIFYHNDSQRDIAEKSKKAIEDAKIYDDPIVTEIVSFTNFSTAEEYHQNFYTSGQRPDYCTYIINPKLDKLEKLFKDKLKPEFK